MATNCCERAVPVIAFCQEDETWTCPECHQRWQYVFDELDGAGWRAVQSIPQAA